MGKLGLAADLWCLINGASVLRLSSSGPESCWVLKWWSDKQRNWPKTNTSSIQLFISNWKGLAQSRTSDLIWRMVSALWIHQMIQQEKTGGFSSVWSAFFSRRDIMIVYFRTVRFTDYLLMWCASGTHDSLTAAWNLITHPAVLKLTRQPQTCGRRLPALLGCRLYLPYVRTRRLRDNHVYFLCPPIMTN